VNSSGGGLFGGASYNSQSGVWGVLALYVAQHTMGRHIGRPEHGRAPGDSHLATRGLDRAPEDGKTQLRTSKQMRPNSKDLQIGEAIREPDT
jgi:hypothetical protein